MDRAAYIAVGNLKGGTGKSTVAVNLACALAASGRPTVLVDADPQLTAARWMGRRPLPARLHEMPVAELDTATDWIDEIQEVGVGHHFVVMDLPAVLGATLGSALLLADLVLIPAAASGLDLSATTRTLHRVARAEEERPDVPLQTLVVPTRLTSGLFRDGGLRKMRIRVPAPMGPPIRYSTLFAQAFDAGDWIGGYAPRSKAHRDILRLMARVTRAIQEAEAVDAAADRLAV